MLDAPNSEESEKVSELKSVSGSSRLPYGTLASGAEGIKEAISSFDDACVSCSEIDFCAPHPYYLGGNRILRMNVSHQSFSMPTQKKEGPSFPTLSQLHHPSPILRELLRQRSQSTAFQRVLKSSWRPVVPLHPESTLPHLRPRPNPVLLVGRLLQCSNVGTRGRQVWALR